MKLTEYYKVGQTVKDNKFSGLTGIVTKVTQRSVRVKMPYSKAMFTGLNHETYKTDLQIL